jgi:hypothetical protein
MIFLRLSRSWLEIVYLPHPLYPPLLEKERGKKKKKGLSPLLDALFGKDG